jgi:hypothetical protein
MSCEVRTNLEPVYKNQALSLKLRTGVDLTGASIVIQTTDPDSIESNKSTGITVDASTGVVTIQYSTNELNKAGNWILIIYDTVAQTPGKPYTLVVTDFEPVP